MRLDATTVAPFPAASTLSRDQFAAELNHCARAMWCIAASVLGDRDRAHDVVQEAAITGLSKLSEFVPGSSFPHWMGQIVRFTALNERRKQQRQQKNQLDSSPTPAAPAARTTGGTDTRLFDPAVEAALATLDETARSCLLLRTTMAMEYRQIADALGIPEGTAMSHVHRARKAMRERLMGWAAQSSGQIGGEA